MHKTDHFLRIYKLCAQVFKQLLTKEHLLTFSLHLIKEVAFLKNVILNFQISHGSVAV